jgi:hypothetical protein
VAPSPGACRRLRLVGLSACLTRTPGPPGPGVTVTARRRRRRRDSDSEDATPPAGRVGLYHWQQPDAQTACSVGASVSPPGPGPASSCRGIFNEL